MKHSAKKQPRRATENHEHHASKPMPSLVFNEIRFVDTPDQRSDNNARNTPPSPQPPTPPRTPHGANGLLLTHNPTPPSGGWAYVWLSVGSVMIIIIGIWLYSLPSRLMPTAWKHSKDYQLLERVEAGWDRHLASSSLGLDTLDKTPLEQAMAIITSTIISSTTVSSTSSTGTIASTTTDRTKP